MPLVWAHAEYLKLRRSLADGRVFDMPSQTQQRYVRERHLSPYTPWRFSHKARVLPAGSVLRLETLAPATVRWSADGWRTVHDTSSRDTGAGLHVADLPTASLAVGAEVRFTFYWPQATRWEGRNFSVAVIARPDAK
ncbi:MAG: hypothetical protein IT180_06790 [Acidobacteria bacterium]|nr:hypothetical protein [Acidobacteriota bacterium]